jgi:hypothetical protein
MYYSIEEKNLLNEEFVAFPNGPVLKSIYRDYRYNGLSELPVCCPVISDPKAMKVLEIVNFLYAGKTTKELVDETHKHSTWISVKDQIPNNPYINFNNSDTELISYYKNLFNVYKNIDFEDLKREEIEGNEFFYFKSNLELTDEIIAEVSNYPLQDESIFLEKIEDELVVS